MGKDNNRRPWPDIKKMLAVAVLSSLIGALAATFITASLLYGRQQPGTEQKPQTPNVSQAEESIIPVIAREVTPLW